MSKEEIKNLKKYPYLVWQDYGCEGWSPDGFKTLKEALEVNKMYDYIITKNFDYEVVERELKDNN